MPRIMPLAVMATLCIGGITPGHRGTVPPGDWTLVFPHPAVGKYEGLAFPDRQHGWVASASGSILVTSDGGATWAVQATGLGRLRSIDFLDPKHGFAGTLTGTLFSTSDGGATWTDIT